MDLTIFSGSSQRGFRCNDHASGRQKGEKTSYTLAIGFSFYSMTNRELLDQAIAACERLKNTEYHITIGKNNNETQIILSFPTDSFHHIIGFHKTKDVNFLHSDDRSRERIYKTVLNNTNNIRDAIASSIFIDKMIPRLTTIIKLEELLDNNKETYYSKSNYYSDFKDIDYDFVFHVKDEDFFMSFYFIKETGTSGQDKYVMVSTFEKEEPRGHCRRPHTLLKKTKVNKVSGAATIIFDK